MKSLYKQNTFRKQPFCTFNRENTGTDVFKGNKGEKNNPHYLSKVRTNRQQYRQKQSLQELLQLCKYKEIYICLDGKLDIVKKNKPGHQKIPQIYYSNSNVPISKPRNQSYQNPSQFPQKYKKFMHNNDSCEENQNSRVSENSFVFDPKLHLHSSRKNTFGSLFRQYEKSTSRSKSKDKFSFKPKSEIRIGTINAKEILGKCQNYSADNSSMVGSRGCSYEHEHSSLESHMILPQPLIETHTNRPQFSFQGNMLEGLKKQNQSQKFSKQTYQNNKQNTNIFISSPHSQPIFTPKYPSSIKPNQPLHTIQEVQQSIRSVQLPVQQNQNIDENLKRKINEHFQEIKENMLRGLVLRSKESGNTIDYASMENFVREIQHAADQVMARYRQKPVEISLKQSNKIGQKSPKLQFSISQSLKPLETQKNNSESFIPLLKVDNCGSEQKILEETIPKKSLENRFKSSKEFDQLLKKGLIKKGQSQQDSLTITQQKPDALKIKIIDYSIGCSQQASQKQIKVSSQSKFKYEQCSKGHSSISSINEESISKGSPHSNEAITINNKEGTKDRGNENPYSKDGQKNRSKDSMQSELQNLNKYTFLKAANYKPKIYTYAEKELDEQEYCVEEQEGEKGNVYNVRYGMRILQNEPEKQRKTQVYRLSPYKFRRKEQVVNEMIKQNLISKESKSIVFEASNN